MTIPRPPGLPRLRITFVIASLGAGGAERVLTRMAGVWAIAHDVTVLTWDDGSTPPFHAVPAGVRHRALALDGHSSTALEGLRRNLSRLARLRRAVRADAPDAIVSFGDRVNVLTLLATHGLGIPVIVSERVDPRMHDPGAAWRMLRPLAYQLAAAVVVQTDRTREYFEQRLRVPLVTIPNPVAVDAGAAAEEPLVVGLGRLVPQKGFDVLLEAFGRSGLAELGWRLEIAGDGPERDRLASLATRLGLDGVARFTGTTQEPAALLRRAGIFALTSRFEGFPNALAEAMALGRAVVATDCPTGPRELTRGGLAGRLVPVDDVPAVAAALRSLASNPPLRRALGDTARAAMAPYELGTVMERWNDLLLTSVRTAR